MTGHGNARRSMPCYTLFLSLSLSPSLPLSLSLSHTQSHNHTHSLSQTQTHTHTHNISFDKLSPAPHIKDKRGRGKSLHHSLCSVLFPLWAGMPEEIGRDVSHECRCLLLCLTLSLFSRSPSASLWADFCALFPPPPPPPAFLFLLSGSISLSPHPAKLTAQWRQKPLTLFQSDSDSPAAAVQLCGRSAVLVLDLVLGNRRARVPTLQETARFRFWHIQGTRTRRVPARGCSRLGDLLLWPSEERKLRASLGGNAPSGLCEVARKARIARAERKNVSCASVDLFRCAHAVHRWVQGVCWGARGTRQRG